MPIPDHQISVKPSPQSPGNGISETLNSKIFRGGMPPDLAREISHLPRSARALGTRLSSVTILGRILVDSPLPPPPPPGKIVPNTPLIYRPVARGFRLNITRSNDIFEGALPRGNIITEGNNYFAESPSGGCI
jgi:hypothetical protein